LDDRNEKYIIIHNIGMYGDRENKCFERFNIAVGLCFGGQLEIEVLFHKILK